MAGPWEQYQDGPWSAYQDTPETVYREDTNQLIEVPSGMPRDEVMYYDDTQNRSQPPSNFWGMQLLRGVGSFIAGTPQIYASEEIRGAEASIEAYKDGLGADDFFNVFNPFKRDQGVAAMGKLYEAMGIKKEGATLDFFNQKLQRGQELLQKNRQFLSDYGLTKQENDNMWFDLGSGFGSVALSIAMTFLTKNPAAATMFFGELQRSQTYIEARDKGFDPVDARGLSNLLGTIEGGIEALGGKIFLDAVGVKGGIKKLVVRSANEAIQEMAQTGGEELVTQASGMRDKDVAGALERIAYSGMIGFIVGAPTNAVVGYIEAQAVEQGVPKDVAAKFAEKITENEDAISGQIDEMIGQELKTLDQVDTAESADVMRKFVSGEDIQQQDASQQQDGFVSQFGEEATPQEFISAASEVAGSEGFVEPTTREQVAGNRTIVDKAASTLASEIQGDDSPDIKDRTTFVSKIGEYAKEAKGFINYMQNSWDDILDIALNVKGVDRQRMIQALSISDNIQKTKQIAQSWAQNYFGEVSARTGIRSPREYLGRIRQDHRVIDIGTFINANGNEFRLQLNKAQIRNLYMIMQQEGAPRDSITSTEGNAFTQEMLDAAFSELDNTDLKIIKSRLEYYQQTYPQIAAVYKRITGKDLPDIQNYSPIRRVEDVIDMDNKEIRQDAGVNDLLQGIIDRAGVGNASLEQRTDNLYEIDIESDEAAMQRHMLQMSHYVSMAEKMEYLNAFFSNKDLRKIIREQRGDIFMNNIDTTLNDFTRGRVLEAHMIGKIVNKLNSNFARSVLALKPAIGIKQLSSIPAYMEYISPADFVSGLVSFAANPQKAIEILGKSSLMQERGANPEKDIADVSARAKRGRFSKNPTIDEVLGYFIKLGDRGAIYAGGWVVYESAIKSGATQEQAIREFERATAQRQQSSDLDQLSGLQRSGAFGRIFSQFMSAPNAYYRAETKAIRQLLRGKMPVDEVAKRVMIYHFVLPMLFQFIADGFEFENEKQARAAVLGAFNGMFVLGPLIQNAIVAPLTDDKSWDTRIANFMQALNQMSEGAEKLIKFEDIMDAVEELAKGSGKLSGVPVEQGMNIAEGIKDISKGDTESGAYLILGWPKSVAKEKSSGGSKRSNSVIYRK